MPVLNEPVRSRQLPDGGASRPRVLVIGASQSPDSMECHVMEALKNIGAPAQYASTALRVEMLGPMGNGILYKAAHICFREPERLIERRLLSKVDRFKPDLVLVLQGNHLSPKTTARIRQRTKAPLVCWCQDQLVSLGRQYMLGA